MCTVTPSFIILLGYQFRSSCLHSKHGTHRGISPTLQKAFVKWEWSILLGELEYHKTEVPRKSLPQAQSAHVHTHTHTQVSAPKPHRAKKPSLVWPSLFHRIAATNLGTIFKALLPAAQHGCLTEPKTQKENWNRKEKVIKKNSPDFSWSHPWVRLAFGVTAKRADQNGVSAGCQAASFNSGEGSLFKPA